MVYDSQPTIVPPVPAGPASRARVNVGVLALQGAFREHCELVRAIGTQPVELRTPDQLDSVHALVIPGGESTTMRKLLASSGLDAPLRELVARGMPALGTCAGMIVLARSAPDGAPGSWGLLDVSVERNGFGRQPWSFEAPVELTLPGHSPRACNGVFIRAPRIAGLGPESTTAGAQPVEVIGRLAAGKSAGEAVAVRQGALLGCSFHPELVGEPCLHELLVSMAAARMSQGGKPPAPGIGPGRH